MRITVKEKQLWRQMAVLTIGKYLEYCRRLGSCCSAEYCEMAASAMKAAGVEVPRRSRKGIRMIKGTTMEGKMVEIAMPSVPFLRADKCIIPPWFRPLCTLHQCKIQGIGIDPKDPKWTKAYFNLRGELDDIAEKKS